MAYPELEDLRTNIPEAEAVALFPAAPYGNGRILQHGSNEPVQLEACPASPDFFRVMGIQPAMGRGFAPEDSAKGAARVAVLADWAWRAHFNASPDVVGRPVRLNGRDHTVIGVMPPEFDFPRGVGLWVNLPASSQRPMTWLQAVVRLRPGVPAGRLHAAADRTFRMQAADFPKQYSPTQRAVVTPLDEFLVGPSKAQLLLSLAASILLLFSACASAGNLFLSRALARRRELAVRASLGATRGQLLAQCWMEAAVAAGIATVAGAGLAAVVARALAAWAPAGIPRVDAAGWNPTVLAAAAVAALAATAACAAGPMLQLRTRSLESLLRSGGPRAAGSRSGSRLQKLFVLAQAALTVTILAACALLYLSNRAILRTDAGVANRDAMTVNLGLRGPKLNPALYRETYARILERLRSSAGVRAAAGVLLRPLEGPIGWDTEYTYEFEGGQRDPNRILKANFEVVTPGYFDAVGTPMLGGRDFSERDSAETAKVVIISQSVARRFREAGLDPLGQRMRVFDDTRTVTGVVADVRFRGMRQPGHDVYVPYRQVNVPTNYLVIAGSAPPAELLALVRKTVKEIAPDQAVAGEATLGQLIDRNTASDRFLLRILAVFAIGAILLVAAGIHSVTREFVTARAKEIAIRMALGATRGRLARDTARRLLFVVGAGSALGAASGFALGSAAKAVLFEVLPGNPAVLGGAACLVMGIAAFSAFVPAWAAAGRDPREELHSD
ncbi:MAG: FtsX-like permease family protein [Acidobacteria bacterium]|nr:FtsX-like permease family protein [Acidobacteriota bacterium]